MTDRPPPLTPYPLRVLLGRIAHEWETRRRILDLPAGKFHHADPVHDLSFAMAGRRPATPIGPAAGPHTQLAGNIVLAWLTGARVIECKTVQVLDELDISRPCIDMEAVGYNVEWSQELSLEQSLTEYVTAWMIIEILRHWEPLQPVLGEPGEHVFDISVGYDLAGISSPSVHAFLDGMRDASAVIDTLRDQIPRPFASFRHHDFDPYVARSVTVSTFHGCPPEEIEGIVHHLVDEHDLDVIVKLNPTLLGHDEVARILHRHLGHSDVELDRAAFEQDLQFDRATSLIPALADHVRDRGHRFGIKLSNTLVVHNHRGVLPDDPMYLSGPPLHVLSMTLLHRLADALPGRLDLGPEGGDVQVSWSAGVDATNVADTLGLGLRPVTVCSNLLQPGGYAHLSSMLRRLGEELTHAAVTDLHGWTTRCHERALELGHDDAVEAYVERLHTRGGADRYTAGRVGKRIRQVDHELDLFGCVACNLCVTVCPNDAMLHLATPDELADELPDRWQYVCLAELCNACGNCTTFCPEIGAPWADKPRLFLDADRFAADDGPAFLLGAEDGAPRITPGPGMEEHLDLLTALLTSDEGLPLRAEDLSPPPATAPSDA